MQPEQLTWVGQVLRFATSRSDEIALRFAGKGTTWSELADRSRRVAGALDATGVRRGDRVIILMTNCGEFVEAVLGIQLLGAIAVPVNFRVVADDVTFFIGNSGASAVVAEEDLAALVRPSRESNPAIGCLVVGDSATDAGAGAAVYADAIATASPSDATGPQDLNELAFIMYTSGTTGRPKGSMLTYGNIMANIFGCVQVIGLNNPDEVTLVTAPLYHTAGIGNVLQCLLLGFRAAILPTGGFSPTGLLTLLEQEHITNVWLVPTQWLAVCQVPDLKDRTFALRRISWGAAPATTTTLEAMAAAFPGVPIFCYFGQTEMSPTTTMLRSEDSRRKLGSVGQPMAAVSVRIVDAEMNDVEPGTVGEIVYRGPTTTVGYWNAPDATAEAFRGGWFHSGDLVRADEEGFIYVVDRLKDVIISGGENIYSAEVENVLSGHPLIAEVAVIGAPDSRWGETPVAFVVARDAANCPSEADVISFARDHLASYKKPTRVLIVETLPRNPAGKVVKARLRELLPVDLG